MEILYSVSCFNLENIFQARLVYLNLRNTIKPTCVNNPLRVEQEGGRSAFRQKAEMFCFAVLQ